MTTFLRETGLFFVVWLLVGAVDTQVRLQLGDSTELVAGLTEADRRERVDAEVDEAGRGSTFFGTDHRLLRPWIAQRGHLLSSPASRADVLAGEQDLMHAGASNVRVARLQGEEGFNTVAGLVVVELPSGGDASIDPIVTAALRRCHLDYPAFARGDASVRRGNAYLVIDWRCDWSGR